MGSKKSSPAPAPQPALPDPVEQARQINQANIEQLGPAAKAYFDVFSNPQYGALPTTQLFEQIRQQVFPQETSVRNQLAQNILQNLISPTGITPDQQTAITQRRSQAQAEVQKAMRERANLGGGLYGGRSQDEEARTVSDLQNAFAEEDIGREERSRLNAIQSALPFLQILFPDVGITPPQFTSPVQSADTYASSLAQQRGQNIQQQISAQQLAQQQQQSNNALYSALFSGLGTAAGGFLGGPGGAALGSQLFGRQG